mmetsp:Transcript_24761/g.58746  ORF Transcript_24761/g.58746 Transcript_24761/m.58746 type:complete len:89 (+) Transcript_24761:417-683(+)
MFINNSALHTKKNQQTSNKKNKSTSVRSVLAERGLVVTSVPSFLSTTTATDTDSNSNSNSNCKNKNNNNNNNKVLSSLSSTRTEQTQK